MNCRLKRLLSSLLVLAMFAGFVPSTMFTTVAKAAETGVEKSPIDQSTYETLGFTTDLGTTDESYLTSKSYGKTTMNTKNELYLDYQAHKNYGWVLRDNLNLHHTKWTSYEDIGAYRLYGQFMNESKTDDLDSKNGWTYGQTGEEASLIGSSIDSTGYHLSRAYKTAVEFRSSSGKLDRVAQLYVTAGANRTDWVAKLEILKYTKGSNGKYTTSVTSTRTLGASPALDESGMIFQQYFDALYDITAGDFDGDGIDEIAVYYGTNEVKIFDTGSSGTSLSEHQTIGKDKLLKNQTISPLYNSDSKHGTENKVERAAIVTLVAGDLKKDFSDDLVITVSMPQDSTGDAHRENPYAYIYGYNKSEGKLKVDKEIPLTTDKLQGKAEPQVFKTANATIGDIDGDSYMELVIGGRLCDASNNGVDDTEWGVGALIPVEYDHGSNDYSVGTASQSTLDEYDSDDVLIKDGIAAQTIRYRAPVAMAIADLDGVGAEAPSLFFFSGLYTYDSGTRSFSATNKYLDTIKNQTNNANEDETKGQHWISDIVVGNFNGNDVGAEQIIAIVACKTDGNTETDQDWYWYYMSYIAYGNITTTKENDTLVVNKGDLSAQCEGIINQGRSYINRSDVTRASTFVSIACPDVDSDSIILEHIGTETYYSKPEVQAVLQSAPYFADVAEVYDNYLNNGATTYGKVSSSSEGGTASIDAALGAYTHVEASIGAAAELEVELRVTASYEHATIHEISESVDHSGGIGDDYVVMYTVPYHRFYYNAIMPKADGTTYTDVMCIEQPLTPSTVIVPVSTYDALAATTEGLEPIRGNILTSTPGDPSSYTTAPKGTWKSIGSTQSLTNAGSSNSETTVSGEMTTTKENSFSVGIEENLNCGFGAGFLGTGGVMGLSQSFAIAGGGTYSNMHGVSCSGSVDNLPAGVTGYSFNWEFGYSETKLNGE
ncbi:MAG: hypothetical protein IKU13_09435, partial [Clostridia bacterium]|nr:hypothetical protein [Clostridia bacterium]